MKTKRKDYVNLRWPEEKPSIPVAMSDRLFQAGVAVFFIALAAAFFAAAIYWSSK